MVEQADRPAAAGSARAGAQPPTIRPAVREDAGRIAELFRISSDGIADYIWRQFVGDYPGLSPLEIGQRRYQREGVAFSYRNCTVAERDGEVVAMAHAFVMPDRAPDEEPEPDPVLAPYAALEVPGSLYLSGLAVLPAHQNRGIGSRLLDANRDRARDLGTPSVTLICFAQNRDAMRLYRRHGFTEIDRRPIVPHPLIHHTGDAVLMAADTRG
ncbi:MAG TPA: GNAT family N-acetyltransferase [Geminicoccaceae bacterium]